jgi:hypothetical protein
MKNFQFESDICVIPQEFNKLKIVEYSGEQFLSGELEIIDAKGVLWDVYNVEIKGSEKYPYCFPKLFEVGGTFPKIVDWHVYEHDDKSCCVDVPMSEKIICKDGLHIKDYIKRFAIPYLANQTYRKREGYYLFGEYSHGVFGRIEYYQEKLKAKNPTDLIKMFTLILKDFNPVRTALCPICGKSKFRKCHRSAFKELSYVKEFLIYDMLVLDPFFKANPNFKLPIPKAK